MQKYYKSRVILKVIGNLLAVMMLHLLAVGELLERDISLSDAVVLEPGQGIERAATYKDWDTFALEE